MKKHFYLVVVFFAIVSVPRTQELDISLIEENSVQLLWQAVPGQTYRVLSVTNLSEGVWEEATEDGIKPDCVIGNVSVPMTGSSGFFRIAKEDTEPPRVTSLFPAADAVAVLCDTEISIKLEDEAGIDESTIALSVAGGPQIGVENTTLSWDGEFLTYQPAEALGDYGETITNRITVSDCLGHTLTNFTWSFTLERITQADADFLPLTAPPQAQLAPLASGGYMRRSLPGVRPLSGVDEYHIVSVTSNEVVFTYDNNAPDIVKGLKLVSFDAAYPMYRMVSDNIYQVDYTKRQVTVAATNIPLSSLVAEGSMAARSLQDITADGVQTLAHGGFNLLHASFGKNMSGEVIKNFGGVKLWLPEAYWEFVADVDVNFELVWFKLKSMAVTVSANFDMNLTPQVDFDYATSGEGETPLVSPIIKHFGGMLGPIPIWVEISLELNAGYNYSASASGFARSSVTASKEMNFTLQLKKNEWSQEFKDKPFSFDLEPLTWQIEGQANVQVFLQPKITVLVYSLAGPWVDVKPYKWKRTCNVRVRIPSQALFSFICFLFPRLSV